MKKQQLVLGLVLFVVGLIGVLSTLTMNIPLPPEVEIALKEKFTSQQIKTLTLVNPTIMLVVAVLIGSLLYKKVSLTVPLIEKIVGIEVNNLNIADIVKYGIFGGVLAGVLLSLIGFTFTPVLPTEFLELGKSLKPSLAARFLYGGLTEEILTRFGLMTLIVWISSQLFKETTTKIYWIGIIVAAFIFAIGHFPIVFQSVESPSGVLLLYILVGNTIGGIIFGWVYWKKGLESAFLAHVFAHIILVFGELLIN